MIEIIFYWMQQLYEALGSTSQISPWTYLLVTLGGIASAISPCYVPVLTMFGAYVGGYAKGNKSGGLHLALPFVFANAATLAIVGAIASLIGKSVLEFLRAINLAGGFPGSSVS